MKECLANAYDGSKKRDTARHFSHYQNKTTRNMNQLYDQHLEICRSAVISLFNKNKDKTLDYIRSEILRDAPDVPTKVIKAVKDDFEEITANDELGVFLPSVRFIKAYASKSSKQNWFLELKSKIMKQLQWKCLSEPTRQVMRGQKKLGQFF